MSTTWTDDEYARVAKALLWPASRRRVVAWGFRGALDAGIWALDAKLSLLTDAAKTDGLALADEINTREAEAWSETLDGLPDIQAFGELKKDAGAGLALRRNVVAEMRARLATAVDHFVNPYAAQAVTGTRVA